MYLFAAAGWWRQCQGAADEYFNRAGSPADPLFQSLLPEIARDRKQLSSLGDAAWEKDVWSSILGSRAVSVKGPKLALCRFLSWRSCLQYWDEHVHSRLLILCFLGIACGHITGKMQSKSLKLKGLNNASGPGLAASSSMAAAQTMARSVYDNGKNQLHVATLILAIPGIIRKSRCMVQLGEPLAEAHSSQSCLVRSPDASHAWFSQQAAGSCLRPLVDIFRLLQTPSALQYVHGLRC